MFSENLVVVTPRAIIDQGRNFTRSLTQLESNGTAWIWTNKDITRFPHQSPHLPL